MPSPCHFCARFEEIHDAMGRERQRRMHNMKIRFERVLISSAVCYHHHHHGHRRLVVDYERDLVGLMGPIRPVTCRPSFLLARVASSCAHCDLVLSASQVG
jgi:hypothetical protein